jgi:hypothetical protein
MASMPTPVIQECIQSPAVLAFKNILQLLPGRINALFNETRITRCSCRINPRIDTRKKIYLVAGLAI